MSCLGRLAIIRIHSSVLVPWASLTSHHLFSCLRRLFDGAVGALFVRVAGMGPYTCSGGEHRDHLLRHGILTTNVRTRTKLDHCCVEGLRAGGPVRVKIAESRSSNRYSRASRLFCSFLLSTLLGLGWSRRKLSVLISVSDCNSFFYLFFFSFVSTVPVTTASPKRRMPRENWTKLNGSGAGSGYANSRATHETKKVSSPVQALRLGRSDSKNITKKAHPMAPTVALQLAANASNAKFGYWE